MTNNLANGIVKIDICDIIEQKGGFVMCKIIKYGLLLIAVAMLVLTFVLPFVATSTDALITTINAEYKIGELLEMEAGSAVSATITAIATVSLVGIAIILAVISDLKVAKCDSIAKIVGILSALAGIACLVSTIVLSGEMADGVLVGITSTDVSIGFASIGAIIGGVLCAGALLLPCKKAKKATKKKATTKKKSTAKKK